MDDKLKNIKKRRRREKKEVGIGGEKRRRQKCGQEEEGERKWKREGGERNRRGGEDNETRGGDITVKLDVREAGARKGRRGQEAEYTQVARGGPRRRKEEPAGKKISPHKKDKSRGRREMR